MHLYHLQNITWTVFFQQSSFIIFLSSIFSFLGSPSVLLLAGFFLFFLHKKQGTRMLVFLAIAFFIVTLSKEIFHHPRPFWVFAQVLGSGKSFGMMSGHSASICVLFYLSLFSKNKNLYLSVSTLGIILVIMSRIALGAHFPLQTAVGASFGLSLSLVLFFLEKYFLEKYKALSLKQIHILYSAILVLLLGTSYLLYNYFARYYKIPVEWVMTAKYHHNIHLKGVQFMPISESILFLVSCLWCLTLEYKTIHYTRFSLSVERLITNDNILFFIHKSISIIVPCLIILIVSKTLFLLIMPVFIPFLTFILFPLWLEFLGLMSITYNFESILGLLKNTN